MPKLFIVATPIGNLSDMTYRAVETLKNVDFVLCEDTRVTQKLLNHFEISTPTMSFHQHSTEARMREIQQLLESGKSLALVSDAGTPGISDPGGLLIEYLCDQEFSEKLEIIPIPGACSPIAALSASGFSSDKFVFLGFVPHKKRRIQFLESVGESSYTVAFFESSHRIAKCIEQLGHILEPERKICIARELTKKFETFYRGTMEEILQMNISPKGEFVVVVEGKKKKRRIEE